MCYKSTDKDINLVVNICFLELKLIWKDVRLYEGET